MSNLKQINLSLGLLLLALFPGIPVLAHTVKTSGDVAATFHIDPHDHPTAGISSRAWFALTRRGGKLIPLSQCNCRLVVYPIPHDKNTTPLEPLLHEVDADNYHGIPGAEITFPSGGEYELRLTGYPKYDRQHPNALPKFGPFKLTYQVFVSGN